MFHSVDQALHWAYQERYRLCIKNSSMNMGYLAPRNDETPAPRIENPLLSTLSSQERQLQAAAIVNTVRNLKPQYAAEYLALKYHYLPPSTKHVRRITKHLLDTTLKDIRAPSSCPNRHTGVSLTVIQSFGAPVGHALSRKCIRASNKQLVLDALDKLGATAYIVLKDIFIEKGVIYG